jgi:hypothetical protein
VNWGDGTNSVEITTDQSDRPFSGAHTYAHSGIFDVTVTVTDDDGDLSVVHANAVVEGAGLVDGTLYIIGTDGRDHVKLKHDGRKDTLKVDAKLSQGGSDGGSDGGRDKGRGKGSDGGKDKGSDGGRDHIRKTFTASAIDRVVTFLFDGDDHYDGGSDRGSDGGSDGGRDRGGDAIAQMVFGGNGRDHISGGRGNDALFGGAGRDDIKGGNGDDILVGGDNKDKLKGGRGNDLLIGGILDNDFDDLSIISDIGTAMTEWAAGVLADTLYSLGTILGDDDKDDLFGQKGDDSLYAGRRDKRTS